MKITADNVDALKESAQRSLLTRILNGLQEEADANDPQTVLIVLLAALDAADEEDMFGTEGWRHRFSIDD